MDFSFRPRHTTRRFRKRLFRTRSESERGERRWITVETTETEEDTAEMIDMITVETEISTLEIEMITGRHLTLNLNTFCELIVYLQVWWSTLGSSDFSLENVESEVG